MSKKKPLILVTNDDGIEAKGLAALVKIVSKIGTPFVVAPDSAQSGQGHAVTLKDPVRLHKRDLFGKKVEAYSCTGTPVDCVKLAHNILLKNKKIDLCVSGINHGSNASINIIYSGTMSAAMEASLENINAIGFSLMSYDLDADFSHSSYHVSKIIKDFLKYPEKETRLLNVNIPYIKKSKIKGIKVCRQAEGRWQEKYQIGKDPRGGVYYWLAGKFVADERKHDTDIWALENGYISIVPSQHDLTDYTSIPSLNYLEKK